MLFSVLLSWLCDIILGVFIARIECLLCCICSQGPEGFGPGRGFGRGMNGRMGGRGFGESFMVVFIFHLYKNFVSPPLPLLDDIDIFSFLCLIKVEQECLRRKHLHRAIYVTGVRFLVCSCDLLFKYKPCCLFSDQWLFLDGASLWHFRLYSGHFIQHCATNGDPNYDIKRVKAPTGIPRSMLQATPEGSYALPSGAVAVLRPNEYAPFCALDFIRFMFVCRLLIWKLTIISGIQSQGCFWERDWRFTLYAFCWWSTTWATLPLVQGSDERCCFNEQVLL